MIKNAITLAVAAVSLTLSLQALAADQEHGADGNHQGAVAKEEAITPQKSCPVMGGKINKDLYVDHDGKRVYVCCKGCVGAVKNDPEKYIKKLAEKGEGPVTVSEAKKEKTDDHDANSMHGEHHH